MLGLYGDNGKENGSYYSILNPKLLNPKPLSSRQPRRSRLTPSRPSRVRLSSGNRLSYGQPGFRVWGVMQGVGFRI